jgi:hypothetical protein
VHTSDNDLLVSKGRHKLQPSADGRNISLQGGNLAIVETLPTLKPGDVGLVHLRHTGDNRKSAKLRLLREWP